MLKHEFIGWMTDYNDNPAVTYRKGTVIETKTYREFIGDIVNYAKYFATLNDQRFALLGDNSYYWFLCFYGGILAGKSMVLIDMLLPISEMETVLKNVDIEHVILSDEISEVKDDISNFDNDIKCSFWSEVKTECDSSDALRWLEENKDNPDGTIFALTSGTTGKAKAVMLGTDAFVYNNLHLASCLGGIRSDRVYSSLPMHHMYGINKTFAFFHKGLEICLGSMRTVVKDIKIFNPKLVLTVPTVVEHLDKKNAFVPSIETILVSGCKCEKKTQNLCDERNIFLQNIYGSSETAGGMALNMPGDDVDVLTVIPGREVLISDGEIVIKTNGRMIGYYNNESETFEKMHDGCVFTGDMGYLDESGKLHINGRKKDMISMANGDKLYCEETDEILSALEHISEAAVIYVDRKLIAVVVPEKNASETAIMNSIESYNNRQQMIRRMNGVWIRKEALPRTSTGKMQRMLLEKQYLEYLGNGKK